MAYTRNGIAQPLTKKDARGITTTLVYDDPLSRLTSTAYPVGVPSATCGALAYTYDEVNRATQERWIMAAARTPRRCTTRAGATLHRMGRLGELMAGESQYWSLKNPLSPGYAKGIGMPNVTPDFIMGGTLKSAAQVITNEAAGLGAKAGGDVQ